MQERSGFHHLQLPSRWKLLVKEAENNLSLTPLHLVLSLKGIVLAVTGNLSRQGCATSFALTIFSLMAVPFASCCTRFAV